jgi:hypothetical protein
MQASIQSTTAETSTGSTQTNTALLQAIAGELDDDPENLDLFEHEISGALYASVADGYQKASIGNTGLEVSHVAPAEVDPNRLESVGHIEPDEGGDVEGTTDSLSFAGD